MKTLQNYDPQTGDWNDSLLGDFLWSNVNTNEALPDVMTPASWSLWRIYFIDTNPVRLPGKYPFCGNIAGRAYLNLSLVISFYRSVGMDLRRGMHADLLGLAQADLDLDIPLIPMPPLAALWMVLPGRLESKRLAARNPRGLADFLANTPGWCRAESDRLGSLNEPGALLEAWRAGIKPRFMDACRWLRSVSMNFADPATQLRRELAKVVGEADSVAILSNLAGASGELESLGPLVGLGRLARGEMTREAYLESYGHRGPHELELSEPGYDETPEELDKQLADFLRSPVDAEGLLAIQREKSLAAWQRLERAFPRRVPQLRRQMESLTAAARGREAVRSEYTRLARLTRQFLLRAGEMTGLEGGIFFLMLEEVEAVLSGNLRAVEFIPIRRTTWQRQRSLPPYPPVIIGRFNPFLWAADPNRRSDYFDARQAGIASVSLVIKGFPGAAGCVEGLVRRIDRMEDGNQVRPGEILVTITTNVGWTPLFPRLAAVVTDVGAPLSHAAIVARELGIPAVVGCGNATMLLKTSDRVRVDGSKGIVEILEKG
jgi:rifampicin phosphotransferase